MAKPVSEEELQLRKRARRRLIGAIALVAAVAAVLPMVLDTEPKPTSREIDIQIPLPDAKGSVAPKAVPVPATKAAAAKSEAKAAEKVAAAPTPAEKPASKPPDNPNDAVLWPAQKSTRDAVAAKPPEKAAEQAPAKAPPQAPAKVPEEAAEKGAAPKAVPESDKAKQVQQQIAGAGIRAYTEVVTAGAGKVTRVRAGPFATREEADKAQAKLQGIGLEGKVAAY
jgi:DedD protein